MEKEKYFENLEDIIYDPIFIGESKEDLNEETINNMWRITLEQQLSRQINVNDFLGFFNKIIKNRQNQLRNSNKKHGMIFYLWFDWMASQLKFNLISSVHEHLPFQCDFEVLDVMEPIIQEFLEYPFLNGLPIEGYSDGTEERPYILKVFRTELTK